MRKVCRRCKQEKSSEKFSPSKNGKGGLNSWCKACHRQYQREYRENYPEKVKERNRKQHERVMELGGRQVVYTESHKRTQEKYRKSEKGRLNHRIKQQRYRQEKRRPKRGNFTREQWKQLVSFYAPNGKCLCCGREKKLTIDHVIPISVGGYNTIDNIQPLCGSCNARKSTETIDYRADYGQFAKVILD